MAVTRPTPKDIGNYEAKLIGPFTQRQTLCLGAGIVPSVIACFIMKNLGFDIYAMMIVVITIMVIPCFLAFGKRFTYGQDPEDFIKDYYYYHIQSSQIRYYEAESFDDKVYEQLLKTRDKAVTKNKKKERTPEPGRYVKYLNKDKYRSYLHRKDKKYNEL